MKEVSEESEWWPLPNAAKWLAFDELNYSKLSERLLEATGSYYPSDNTSAVLETLENALLDFSYSMICQRVLKNELYIRVAYLELSEEELVKYAHNIRHESVGSLLSNAATRKYYDSVETGRHLFESQQDLEKSKNTILNKDYLERYLKVVVNKFKEDVVRSYFSFQVYPGISHLNFFQNGNGLISGVSDNCENYNYVFNAEVERKRIEKISQEVREESITNFILGNIDQYADYIFKRKININTPVPVLFQSQASGVSIPRKKGRPQYQHWDKILMITLELVAKAELPFVKERAYDVILGKFSSLYDNKQFKPPERTTLQNKISHVLESYIANKSTKKS